MLLGKSLRGGLVVVGGPRLPTRLALSPGREADISHAVGLFHGSASAVADRQPGRPRRKRLSTRREEFGSGTTPLGEMNTSASNHVPRPVHTLRRPTPVGRYRVSTQESAVPARCRSVGQNGGDKSPKRSWERPADLTEAATSRSRTTPRRSLQLGSAELRMLWRIGRPDAVARIVAGNEQSSCPDQTTGVTVDYAPASATHCRGTQSVERGSRLSGPHSVPQRSRS